MVRITSYFDLDVIVFISAHFGKGLFAEVFHNQYLTQIKVWSPHIGFIRNACHTQ